MGRKPNDLTGKRFGKITAIKDSGERYRGTVVWECKCDCGNIKNYSSMHLVSGHINNCGCESLNLRIDNFKKGYKKFSYDETLIYTLSRKKSSLNKSGHKGVSLEKKTGKYRATMQLKGKFIHIGYFDKIEDAIKARKLAEEKYFQPIIDKFNEQNKAN